MKTRGVCFEILASTRKINKAQKMPKGDSVQQIYVYICTDKVSGSDFSGVLHQRHAAYDSV